MAVHDRQAMPGGARADQAVHTRADRESGAPGAPVQIDRVLDHGWRERPFPGTIDTVALLRGRWTIAAHLRQVAGPQPGSGELLDALHRLGPPHHLAKRPLDGPGVRALAADFDGLLEQMLI